MDIVERLRLRLHISEDETWLTDEAADKIEQLRADVDRMASLAIDNARDTLRLREALRVIGYGPPHEGEPLELLNQFVDIARAALKEGE